MSSVKTGHATKDGAPVESLTKMEAAVRSIRLFITEGAYKPGERLQVNAVAEELGVSPTPIREAFRVLETEGLVEHTPHHGVRVARISEDVLAEVDELRRLLEPMAARLAAEHATEEQIAAIRRVDAEFARLIEQNPASPDLQQLNRQLHDAIYEAADSRLLLEFIRRLWSSVPVKLGWSSRVAQDSVAQHGALIAAIARRDGAGAEQIMLAHLRPWADRLRQVSS
jgi:DNA-binding GntR family transcriptional regulator